MKLHERFLAGIKIPFGSPNTPVTQGFWRRFNPWTGEEHQLMFLPSHGLPRTLGQDRPREASPTGKSGMGIATYSIGEQDVASARRSVIMTDTNPIYKGEGKLQTRGVINPYVSQIQGYTMVPYSSFWGS